MGRRRTNETEDEAYEKQKFYVFYDKQDQVRYCGTAQQLVDEGRYSSLSSFYSSVKQIQQSRSGGTVVILLGTKTKKKAVKK